MGERQGKALRWEILWSSLENTVCVDIWVTVSINRVTLIGSEVWVSDSDSVFTTYQPWDKATTSSGFGHSGPG